LQKLNNMRRFSIRKYIICILLISGITFSAEYVYSSPYELSPLTDGLLIGSGAAFYGLSLYTGKKIDPLTDKEIAELSKNDINSFDRSAADNWSRKADKWSDRTLTPIMISPLAFLAADETRNDFITIGVMYAESLLITSGLNGTVKNIAQRNRPYTYNPDVSVSEKKEEDAVLSFYSGHTVNAFNSAVFVSTVFADYYPESSWRYFVWGTTLSAASLTGYLRYKAGMHYPTDIITGAVIGSVTGWLIPVLHHPGSRNISFQIIAGEENMIAVVLSF